VQYACAVVAGTRRNRAKVKFPGHAVGLHELVGSTAVRSDGENSVPVFVGASGPRPARPRLLSDELPEALGGRCISTPKFFRNRAASAALFVMRSTKAATNVAAVAAIYGACPHGE
jgi:hypothetical protein